MVLRWCWTLVNGQLWSVKSPCVRALVWLSNTYFIPNLSVIMIKGAKKLGMFREIEYQFTRFVKDYYYSQKTWFSEECEQPSECAVRQNWKLRVKLLMRTNSSWGPTPHPFSFSLCTKNSSLCRKKKINIKKFHLHGW